MIWIEFLLSLERFTCYSYSIDVFPSPFIDNMQDVYANSFFTLTAGFCNSCLWNTFLWISILGAIGLVVMSTCYPLVLFNQLIYVILLFLHLLVIVCLIVDVPHMDQISLWKIDIEFCGNLIIKYSQSRNAALNYCLGQSQSLWYCCWESKGKIQS